MKKIFLTILSLVTLDLYAANAGFIEDEIKHLKNPDAFECLVLGDTYFGENIQDRHSRADSDPHFNAKIDEIFADSAENFKDLLKDSDVNIANLETALTHSRCSPLRALGKRSVNYSNIDETVETLKRYNIHAVSLANNHTVDFGAEGIRQTCGVLASKNIRHFGLGENENRASQPYIINFPQRNGTSFRIAFIGAFEKRPDYNREKFDAYARKRRPGVNGLDVERIKKTIEEIRKVDKKTFIILFPHWGRNYEKITLDQKNSAQDLASLGINAIVGHGAHTAQPIVRKDDGIVAFNIGNFMNNTAARCVSKDSCQYSFLLKLIKPLDNNQVIFRFYPIFEDISSGKYSPRFVDQSEFEKALEYAHISNDSDKILGRDKYGHFIEYRVFDRLLEGSNSNSISKFTLADSYPVSEPLYETEDKTREKVNSSGFSAQFISLVENFEYQINPYYCAATTAVIVMNAVKHNHLASGFEKWTQTNFFNSETDGIKTIDEVLGKTARRVGKKNRRGLTLDNVYQMMKIHGVAVTKRQAVDGVSDEVIKHELAEVLSTPGRYVIVNFARPLIGQDGAGHFSPIAAYDSTDDSYLSLDSNPRRGKWLWVPSNLLFRAMRDYNDEIRGYLIVDSPH